MVLELGPCPADDVLRWSKFARRILVELRTNPANAELVSPDVIAMWSKTVEEWWRIAAAATGSPAAGSPAAGNPAISEAGSLGTETPFRWSVEMEPEVAEFLLDGLDRCLHSPTVMAWVTPEEAEQQRAFTATVCKAFLDGLNAEGHSGQHFADQILTSWGDLLND